MLSGAQYTAILNLYMKYPETLTFSRYIKEKYNVFVGYNRSPPSNAHWVAEGDEKDILYLLMKAL